MVTVLLKRLGQFLGVLRATPHLIIYAISAVVIGREHAFARSGEAVATIPGQIGIYTRQAFYRRTLAHVGRDVYLGFMSIVTRREARLGYRAYVGRFCSIGWADIGDGAKLADGVRVLSGRHQHLQHGDRPRLRKISIRQNVWIGAGAVIMADVGECAIVGAGAVVTRPVSACTTVAGVPAAPLHASSQTRAA